MAFIRKSNVVTAASKIPNVMGLTDVRSLKKFAENNQIDLIPLDVERLAESLGLKVRFEQFQDDVSGYLRKTNYGWVIGINAYHHKFRRRFSIAHEIAHYILHASSKSEFIDEVYLRRTERRDRMELEADSFAAELLMPENDFKESIKSGVKKLSSLSERYQTSVMAIRYRARDLGYQVKDE